MLQLSLDALKTLRSGNAFYPLHADLPFFIFSLTFAPSPSIVLPVVDQIGDLILVQRLETLERLVEIAVACGGADAKSIDELGHHHAGTLRRNTEKEASGDHVVD